MKYFISIIVLVFSISVNAIELGFYQASTPFGLRLNISETIKTDISFDFSTTQGRDSNNDPIKKMNVKTRIGFPITVSSFDKFEVFVRPFILNHSKDFNHEKDEFESTFVYGLGLGVDYSVTERINLVSSLLIEVAEDQEDEKDYISTSGGVLSLGAFIKF